MARKYGGSTGPKVQPTQESAAGAWVAGTEVFRERTDNTWPLSIPVGSASTPAGSYVLAPSSGVLDNALAGGDYVVASGGVLNRTTYSALFNVLGTSFGAGDGSSTFGTPNLYDKFIYFKGITASGTTPLVGSGVIGASHTHTWNYSFTTDSPPRNRSQPNPRRFDGIGGNIVFSSVEGDAIQNELRKREALPLIAATAAPIPVGCVMPVLWPSYNGSNFPTTQYLICSGQAVSRSAYPTLFQRLGVLYGSGDNSTTFNIPDYRGLFVSSTRQPASRSIQVSGIINGSGFLPDAFAFHYHKFIGGNFFGVGGDDNSGPSYGTSATTPASTSSSGPTQESRVANLSIIWVLVAN